MHIRNNLIRKGEVTGGLRGGASLHRNRLRLDLQTPHFCETDFVKKNALYPETDIKHL